MSGFYALCSRGSSDAFPGSAHVITQELGGDQRLPGVAGPVPGAAVRAGVSPLTTTVYTQSSDQEMYERVRGLSC